MLLELQLDNMTRMNQLNHYYLQEIGIEPWVLRQEVPSGGSLDVLSTTVSSCTDCLLYQSRTQTVFSRGSANARMFVLGEAPGFYEDKQGLPFVGEAGQLLDKMLQSIGLSEETVYITNVLKCRPPENRDPKPDEVASCSRHLSEQINLIAPRLILALGRFAGQFLLKDTKPLGKMRNQVHQYGEIPVIVTYHPAYLLRNPADKGKAYQDLLRTRQLMNSMGLL